MTAPTVKAPARDARKIARPAMSSGGADPAAGDRPAQRLPVGALDVATGADPGAEHPGRERARGDGVEHDVAPDELAGELAVSVCSAAFDGP